MEPVADIRARWSKDNKEMVDEYAKIFRRFTTAQPPQRGQEHSNPTQIVLLSSYQPTSKNSKCETAAAALCEVTSKRVTNILHTQVGYKEVQVIRNLLAIWIPVITANTFPEEGQRDGSTPWEFWDQLDRDHSVGVGIAISSQEDNQEIDQLSKEKLMDEQFLDEFYDGLITNPKWSSVGVGVKGESVPDPVIVAYAHSFIEVVFIFSCCFFIS